MRIISRVLIGFVFFSISMFGANIKTPSDVYSYASILKEKVQYLRQQDGIKQAFPTAEKQKDKFPRHVIQKALEVLSKINLYRESKNYGQIYIPPYPARDITPSDVYDLVKRLDEEITPLIKNKKFLSTIKIKHFENKTPSDVYRLLWSISLAFDSLLGIHGYTPTDVYALSQKLLQTVKYIAQTQNIYTSVKKPKKREGLHPNHALYASYKLLNKIALAEKKLWITPTQIPAKPHRVITPTDVYDAMQYNIAELQRIKHRLGVERYFKLPVINTTKNPSDVVQNIEYAMKFFPDFKLEKKLVQYPQHSLDKTPNDVYAATQEILKKLKKIKAIKGISQRAKEPPFIYGLQPSHAYQKALEATEKSIRLKIEMGFFQSQIPSSPLREITPNEVYESVLRLDGIATLILKKTGYENVDAYIYKIDKDIYTNKTPSDVYQNLWRISNQLDIILLASEYSPNETYYMATKIEEKIDVLIKKLNLYGKFDLKIDNDISKTPKDVFKLTLELFESIKQIQKRLNMDRVNISIPKEKNITPNTVYNALRILNASINEILIYLDVENTNLNFINISKPINKTPTDVYIKLKNIQNKLYTIFNDENYDK